MKKTLIDKCVIEYRLVRDISPIVHTCATHIVGVRRGDVEAVHRPLPRKVEEGATSRVVTLDDGARFKVYSLHDTVLAVQGLIQVVDVTPECAHLPNTKVFPYCTFVFEKEIDLNFPNNTQEKVLPRTLKRSRELSVFACARYAYFHMPYQSREKAIGALIEKHSGDFYTGLFGKGVNFFLGRPTVFKKGGNYIIAPIEEARKVLDILKKVIGNGIQEDEDLFRAP